MSQSASRGFETRERILSAGKKVIFEKGFHSSRVSDITRKAGLAHGTFYIYFPAKEYLLLELLKTVREEMLNLIDNGIEKIREGKVKEGKNQVFIEPFRLMMREKELAKIFFFEAICSSKKFQDFYREGKEVFYQKTVSALSLINHPKPDILAHIILGTARHLIESYILTGKEVEALWVKVLKELGVLHF